MTQRCPGCMEDLDLQKYPPSHRGKKGKQCRKCHVDRQRRANLKRNYGLTIDDVSAMIKRQGGLCLGCQKELPRNYVIDHDHKNGRVRGILCRPCNLTLGLIEDDKARLTRLRLYLERDSNKTNIYVIGSLRNKEVTIVSAALRSAGFSVWDEWVAAGPEADEYWQRYETAKGHSFTEALNGLAAQNVFYFDKGLIDLADAGILVMPAGKSAHLELGYMAAKGKKTYIFQDKEPERFDVMPQFAKLVTTRLEEIIDDIKMGS